MARLTKAMMEQAEADRFRAACIALLKIRHPDWNDWEWDWLESEARKQPDYRQSDKERNILARLSIYSSTFEGYGSYSVHELIQMAYSGRCDLDEDGQEFIERLHAWNATTLKRRQIRRLASICRLSHNIGYDDFREYMPPEPEAA